MNRQVRMLKAIPYEHLTMLSPTLAEKVKLYKELQKEMTKVKEDIKEAFFTTQTGNIAMSLAGQKGYARSERDKPTVTFAKQHMELRFTAKDVTPTTANLHREPSTVNMLLNGNILDREEKRKLLEDLGYLNNEHEPHPHDYDESDPVPEEIPF